MAQLPVSPRIEKFTHLLGTVGFENAPFAWHVSGFEIDVVEFAELISKEESE